MIRQTVALPVIDKAHLRQAAQAAWNALRNDDVWVGASGSTGETHGLLIDRHYDPLRCVPRIPLTGVGERLAFARDPEEPDAV